MPERTLSDWAIYGRLLRQARPYWGRVILIFLVGMIGAPLALLGPVPMKIVVDSVIGTQPLPGVIDWLVPTFLAESRIGLLSFATGMMVALVGIGQLLGIGGGLLGTYTSSRLVLDFRARLFRHAQRLSVAFHDKRGTTDSMLRIQYDTSCISGIAIQGVIPFVSLLITFLAMLYVTFRLDAQLATVALMVTPIIFILTRVYGRLLRVKAREVKELRTKAFSVLHETLSALRVVKAFGQEDYEEQRFVDGSLEGISAGIRLSVLGGVFGLLIALTTTTGAAAVLFIGTRHVLAGTLLLGELLMIMQYLRGLIAPVKALNAKFAGLQAHFASADRVFNLLDRDPDVPERPGARSISRAVGNIAFRNVSFTYGDGQEVLHDVSFEVPPGTTVGIFGETGGGKTTIVNLLTRFYDPTDGAIHLDGTDLRDYKVADLRNQFSLVLQDPVLFSSSIAENIAYARRNATMDEIVAAAQAAEAHSFVTALPEGYETKVGERGMRLSGGERQRISLARAFLNSAPILVLDEPTSSVDPTTENLILRAMERLTHGRTTFMIAHRHNTLQNCDVLFEVKDGRLAQREPSRLGAPI